MSETIELPIDFELHDKQGEAFETPATEVLYGGAAGGGKSHLMRIAAITWCLKVPGLQVYLFRRISEDLVKNHIEGPKGLRALLSDLVDVGYVEIVESEIRFGNGSKIYLCHCKDEAHRFKYQGAEIHVLLMDELTTFTETIYRFLRGRCRAVGLTVPPGYEGMFPRILASSNPGNIGHHWVKATFIDNVVPLELRRMPDEEGGMLRQFIPARLEDNPSMAVDDPKYRARLRGLGSPALVRAMEQGDWSVVAGAFFTEFTPEQHVIEPFEIPQHWARIRAGDWGSAKPFSIGWYAVSDGEIHSIPRGALIKYREWYGMREGQANVGLKLTAEEVADGIADREAADPKMARAVLDPAAFSSDGGPSIAERMARHRKVGWTPADNKRVATRGALGGWDQLRQRLIGTCDRTETGLVLWDTGRPMIFFFKTCVHTIRTIPALQHDELKPEDVDTDSEDHAGDETRYACLSRPWVKDKPAGERAPRFLEQMTANELFWPKPQAQRAERI